VKGCTFLFFLPFHSVVSLNYARQEREKRKIRRREEKCKKNTKIYIDE